MKTFITEDFLLQNATARTLYHEHAKTQPIYDYHCHIPQKLIAENYQFKNLYDIWLAGDHYKWRAMRSNGTEEKYCTGEASDYDKFLAYAKTVPQALRNPLYHWTHLELLRYFGIDDLLDESSAKSIWNRANELLSQPDFRTQQIIQKSNVRVICTTDDPTDDLAYHQAIRKETSFKTKVYPAFRPDKAFMIDQPEAWNQWVKALEKASGKDCSKFKGFIDALEARHQFFHENGCRLSDHGLNYCPGQFASDQEASDIFNQVRAGKNVSALAAEKFAGYMMIFFGQLDAQKGWTKQLHLGAMRNNNTQIVRTIGADTGFDSIGDWPQASTLARYMDALQLQNSLPKTILYNNNPKDNYVLGTLIGNFQDSSIPGKIQFGSGWWFLDQKEGMEWQINALSNLGLLSRFVGMLTDSRSFLSYSRHEYFRRILCNMIGKDVENGELPRDIKLLGSMVENICYKNAVQYFQLEGVDS